jgi:SAM-dependent methyltransferase
LFINPFYFARKGLYQHVKDVAHHISGDILDVGCGQKPYQHLFATRKYVGMEVEQEGPLARAGADRRFLRRPALSLPGGYLDSVLTSQVLEHVFTPQEFLGEIYRVLRPGGNCCSPCRSCGMSTSSRTTMPATRVRPQHLLQQSGFEVVEARKSTNDTRVIFQLINGYIYKKTVTRNRRLNLLSSVVLMAPFNLLGELFGRILPANSDLYLDNVIIAKKPA